MNGQTDANSLIAARQDSTDWYSGIGLADGISALVSGFESGTWIDASIGGLVTSMEALAFCTDPLGSLVSWGVAWLIEHVKPLSDALDWLAGDPDQITAYAQTWHNVAKHVTGQAATLATATRIELSGWIGHTSEAYLTHSRNIAQSLQSIGEAAHAIGNIVRGAGFLVATVRELVRDLIAEFVSILAVRLWEWTAEVGVTLGAGTPLVVSQVSALVAKWAAKVARVINGLIASIGNLMPMLRNLDNLIKSLNEVLRNLRRQPDTAGIPTQRAPVGRPPTDDLTVPGVGLDGPALASTQTTPQVSNTEPVVPGKLSDLDPTGPSVDSVNSASTPGTEPPHGTAYYSSGDPMRELGAGRDTHPAEWQALEAEARSYGVEIIHRDGGIFYTPGTRRGSPGQLVIDPDSSISAIRHELSHIRDDLAAGWRGFEGVYDRDFLWASEERAYMLEVNYAREIGRDDLAEELLQLMRDRKNEIYGAP
ncbi:WXG100 family type VII secretion target [Micromonospora sp. NPDC003197]